MDNPDCTPWHASFWEFCARYCSTRFGREWFLSAEESLALHGEKTVIPQQVVICSPKGSNHTMELLFGTLLYDLKVSAMPAPADLMERDGLRLFSPAAALVRATESFLTRNPVEAQVVLEHLGDASDLLRLLLNGGHSAKAACLAGAFRQMGRCAMADEIIGAMKSAGYDVRESNPFVEFISQRVRWSVERCELEFAASEESYNRNRAVVIFWWQDGKKRVRCEISREVLDDHFKADNKDRLEVFRANRRAIEKIVRRKYLTGQTEPDGSVLIRTLEL